MHRRPHIAILRKQVPARGFELVRLDASAFVDVLKRAAGVIHQGMSPREVAIAFDDGMRSAQVERFLRVQSRMNAAEDDAGPAFPQRPPQFVAA